MDPLLLIAIVLAGLLLAGAGLAMLGGNRGQQVDKRLEEFVVGATTATTATIVPNAPPPRIDVADRLDERLVKKDFAQKIKDRLAKADLKLRVSEYIALQVGCCLGAAGAVYLFFDQKLLFAILGAIAGLRLPLIYTNMAANRRL
ncbi:MAG: hypothetical protein AB1791_17090, partial [Chloroflexota bacterium]